MDKQVKKLKVTINELLSHDDEFDIAWKNLQIDTGASAATISLEFSLPVNVVSYEMQARAWEKLMKLVISYNNRYKL